METRLSTDDFVRELAKRHRVLMLGGMAVIAHGLSRPTKDSDIWLEPFVSSQMWAQNIARLVSQFSGSYLWSLAERRIITPDQIVADADTFGVIRIGGLSLPLDIFRKPNELEIEDFENFWANASELKDGIRLPSEMDLYVTKANTGREHDWKDQLFLEGRVKARFRERLPVCDLAEAQDMLSRFLDPEVLGYAQANPNADVRDHVLVLLREFEADGDPYSRDILATWKHGA